MRQCVSVFLAVLVSGCAGGLRVPANLQTTAEASNYEATTSYADVVRLLDLFDAASDDIHVTSFGTSVEGRDLPLVIWGAPSADAAAVRATGKTVVFVFGNIHAGEVAGKEALLAMIRDISFGRQKDVTDSLVVLLAPIYNADGNERVELDNRPLQYGPIRGMGQRPTAMGLDLNRDLMKVAAPETAALLGVLNDYDPQVFVDLHVTNGSHMGYHLTYAPGLSPNGSPAISDQLFNDWLPAISAKILATDDMATYHYGNVPGAFGESTNVPRAWYSFSAQARYATNYAGLRNRYSILSEAYSYATFKDRIDVTRRFVEEILDHAHANATRVRNTVRAAEREDVIGQTLATRTEWAALDRPEPILLGEVDTVQNPYSGKPMLLRTDARIPETMPAYVRFVPSESEVVPASYAIGPGPWQDPIRELLDRHGIVHLTTSVWGQDRQMFVIDSSRVSPRPFQGVRMQEVFGSWKPHAAEIGVKPARPPAYLVVPLDNQPLARLVFTLLEPRSEDGVVAWGVVPPDALEPGGALPIQRILRR